MEAPCDGTVTDSVTGLIWDRCSSGQTLNTTSDPATCFGTASTHTWQAALGVAVTANTLSYKGHTDWRLPNRKELESLVEIQASYPAIDTTAFPDTPSNSYWSSTPYTPNPAGAWYVYFSGGDTNAGGRSNGGHVRLVRGGQSFDSFDVLSPPPCGLGLALPVGPPALWQQFALPCVPDAAPASVANVLGAGTTGQLDPDDYNSPNFAANSNWWRVFHRDNVDTANELMPLDGASGDELLSVGAGYWLKSLDLPVGGGNLTVTGTVTPTDVDLEDGCAVAASCKAIDLVVAANRFNMVGDPFPYNVDWAQVRILVDGGTRTLTPSEAQTAGYLSNQIWIWSGTQCETWSDVSIPTRGNLKYFQSFWV
jgi:hypothetical protein